MIRGILLDLDGVVYTGTLALPGSLKAIQRIRQLGMPLKFITNTTRRPRRKIVADLATFGLDIDVSDLFTPAALACEYLLRRHLVPILVVHPDLQQEFARLPRTGREAVVIGDAGPFFSYDLLNGAFRHLIRGAEFLALAKNRNFLDGDGQLSLDAGPFVAALEYASGKTAAVIGKPAPAFFKLAVEGLGCSPAEAVMIGDDVEADVGGAIAAGLKAVLVRTGKYRPGHEAMLAARAHIAENLEAAIELLFG
ncbi:MAG TPA: TIGR01458 family HAD-type hydrolase [Methylocella sp.]|nr:TIGR01458 family HAD-type hydrolase [Methylocella sp.]